MHPELQSSRLLKKTHMLRYRSIASLQRTASTSPLVDFRAPRTWIFLSSLQEAFFSAELAVNTAAVNFVTAMAKLPAIAAKLACFDSAMFRLLPLRLLSVERAAYQDLGRGMNEKGSNEDARY